MSSHVALNVPNGIIDQTGAPGSNVSPSVNDTSDAIDEKIGCITCDSLDIYTELSKGYIEAISLALYDPVLTVFASLVGLWVVVSGLQIWLAMVSPVHIMRDLYQKAKLINKKPSRPCEHF